MASVMQVIKFTYLLRELSHNFMLQRLNAAELLRLYIDFDLLEEAAHLTMEYIDAVLGAGPEYFGLKVRTKSFKMLFELENITCSTLNLVLKYH